MIYIMNEKDEELENIRRKKLEKMLQESKKKEVGRMYVRMVIPVLDESGLNARLSEHFGRAPYFAVIELDSNGSVLKQRAVPNVSEHFGGSGRPPDRILQLEPDAIVTYGMGPRALTIFQNAKVAVLRATTNAVKGVIVAFNKGQLEELTEGCLHARHR